MKRLFSLLGLIVFCSAAFAEDPPPTKILTNLYTEVREKGVMWGAMKYVSWQDAYSKAKKEGWIRPEWTGPQEMAFRFDEPARANFLSAKVLKDMANKLVASPYVIGDGELDKMLLQDLPSQLKSAREQERLLAEFFRGITFEVAPAEIHENTAEAKVTLINGNRKDVRTIGLVKTAQGWKIDDPRLATLFGVQ